MELDFVACFGILTRKDKASLQKGMVLEWQ